MKLLRKKLKDFCKKSLQKLDRKKRDKAEQCMKTHILNVRTTFEKNYQLLF